MPEEKPGRGSVDPASSMMPPCPLCGRAGPFPTFDSHPPRAANPCVYLRCPSCDLIFLSRPPLLEEVRVYYDRVSRDQEANVEFHGKALRTGHGLLERIESRIPKGRFLDVGAGPGYYVEAAAQRGWEAYGVDPIADDQAGVPGLRMFRGTLEEAGYPEGFFDACLIQQALSHMSAPTATLKQIFRNLRRGGIFLIVAPNFVRGFPRRRLTDWEDLTRAKHLYVFTRSTLRRIVENAGFRTLSVSSEQPILSGRPVDALRKAGLSPLADWVKRSFRGPVRGLRTLAGRLVPGPCSLVLSEKP
ncbi:MAG: class I SAM-dependent methyltransferase [Nitrospirae bacterium]|nr:class I SAM-dependent methyltransferase [Nitrospirota bacterium]